MKKMSVTMKSTIAAIMVLGLLHIPVSRVSAAEPTLWPSMTVGIGGENITVGVRWNYDAPLDKFTLAAPVTATATNGSSLTISHAEAIPDPVLLFAASAVNTTANPLAYSFAFNTPLVPNLLGPVTSHAELGVALTDGLNNGATIQPTTLGGKMLTSFDLYSNGTPITKNVDIGDLFSILSGTGGTTFSKDGALVCTQACVTMSAVLSFILTAEDSVGFSGKVVQTAVVPLPAAVWLFASGAISMLAGRRRVVV